MSKEIETKVKEITLDNIKSLNDEEKKTLIDYINDTIKKEITNYHNLNLEVLKSIDEIISAFDETINNNCLDLMTIISILCQEEDDIDKYLEIKENIRKKLEEDFEKSEAEENE